jgi:hypothetical protein
VKEALLFPLDFFSNHGMETILFYHHTMDSGFSLYDPSKRVSLTQEGVVLNPENAEGLSTEELSVREVLFSKDDRVLTQLHNHLYFLYYDTQVEKNAETVCRFYAEKILETDIGGDLICYPYQSAKIYQHVDIPLRFDRDTQVVTVGWVGWKLSLNAASGDMFLESPSGKEMALDQREITYLNKQYNLVSNKNKIFLQKTMYESTRYPLTVGNEALRKNSDESQQEADGAPMKNSLHSVRGYSMLDSIVKSFSFMRSSAQLPPGHVVVNSPKASRKLFDKVSDIENKLSFDKLWSGERRRSTAISPKKSRQLNEQLMGIEKLKKNKIKNWLVRFVSCGHQKKSKYSG